MGLGRQLGSPGDEKKRPLKLEQVKNLFFAGHYLGGTRFREGRTREMGPQIYRLESSGALRAPSIFLPCVFESSAMLGGKSVGYDAVAHEAIP